MKSPRFLPRLKAASQVLVIITINKNEMNYLLALLFPLFFIGCDKLRPCANYSFKGTMTIVNDKPVISLSDTLWLEIAADKTQLNPSTNSMLTVNGAINFSQSVAVANLLPMNTGVIALKKFSIIIVTGETIPTPKPDSYMEIKLAELPGKYLAKIGFKPLEKGVFELATTNVANVFSEGKNCTRGGYNFSFTNENLHTSYANEMAGFAVDSFRRHNYFFKVE